MGAMKAAIKVANLDEVRGLLREGFDINTVDYDGRTVLHVAAAYGDVKLVEMLLNDYHAISSADRYGCSTG